ARRFRGRTRWRVRSGRWGFRRRFWRTRRWIRGRRRLGALVMRVLRHLFTPFWLLRLRYPREVLQRVEQRIAAMEARHPGELRFVAEHALDLGDLIAGLTPRQRALEVFGQLRVWDTERNNGILIYVLHAEHAVEIIADRALARLVPQAD